MTNGREAFLHQAAESLNGIVLKLNQQENLDLSALSVAHAVLVVIDMNVGFTRRGALHSARIDGLTPEVTRIQRYFQARKMPTLAFTDAHSPTSPEFIQNGGAYPEHCIAGTEEAELIAEIKEIGGYTLIPKNSTNGALEPAFAAWRAANPERNLFVIVGDCTDICVADFARTLKADANRKCEQVRIVVVANAVDTYDAPWHSADLMHIMSLYMMMGNGIQIAPRAI